MTHFSVVVASVTKEVLRAQTKGHGKVESYSKYTLPVGLRCKQSWGPPRRDCPVRTACPEFAEAVTLQEQGPDVLARHLRVLGPQSNHLCAREQQCSWAGGVSSAFSGEHCFLCGETDSGQPSFPVEGIGKCPGLSGRCYCGLQLQLWVFPIFTFLQIAPWVVRMGRDV